MNFKVSDFNRSTLTYLLEKLTPEQLYFIPKGFNNNIIWNIGHLIITKHMLTYALSGLKLPIDKKFIKRYAKGSQPTITVSEVEIKELKAELIPSLDKINEDYAAGIFKNYKEYTTSFDITLKNIEEALEFNSFHEGVHLGMILSIKKLL